MDRWLLSFVGVCRLNLCHSSLPKPGDPSPCEEETSEYYIVLTLQARMMKRLAGTGADRDRVSPQPPQQQPPPTPQDSGYDPRYKGYQPDRPPQPQHYPAQQQHKTPATHFNQPASQAQVKTPDHSRNINCGTQICDKWFERRNKKSQRNSFEWGKG